MKRYIILFFLPVALLINSCTKDLTATEYSEINPNIFPKSAEDLEAMVNACYHPIRGSWWDGFFSTSERGSQFINDASTEILFGKFGEQQLASLQSYQPGNGGITRFYDDFYNKISRMTITIDLIQNSTVSEELKKKAIAEVRCARGLLAYSLFDMYGPLVIAPLEVLKNPLQEKPLARLSNEEMVAYIDADLEAAIPDLPSAADVEYGRFSKALAKMIQIRLWLHEKNWAKVNALCDDIIDMNFFSLHPDYKSMWDLDGGKNSRDEVIWAIPCDYAGTSENQWQMMALPSNYPVMGGWQTITSTWWFYDRFEPTDKRREMLIAEYPGTDGITYNRANPGQILDRGPIALKINEDNQRTTSLTTVDIIMYRYADVLLSKAEALANSGAPTQQAMDLVNLVRRRAGLADKQLSAYSSLAAFNDLVLLERSHEFWCENGQYRADLIRHGKFTSRCQEVTGSTFTTPDKVRYPFSLRVVSEGKGLFIQNPGYN